MSANVACVVDCRNALGEVPVWDVREQALYWVDIEGKLLQRYRPASGRVERWTMPERIGSFALREQCGLIVAFASGIAFYDLESGAIDWIARPEADRPGNRFNEGKCDRRGRFWAGTMDDSLAAQRGALPRRSRSLDSPGLRRHRGLQLLRLVARRPGLLLRRLARPRDLPLRLRPRHRNARRAAAVRRQRRRRRP
jgi:sugar lactone lactonase YvrE